MVHILGLMAKSPIMVLLQATPLPYTRISSCGVWLARARDWSGNTYLAECRVLAVVFHIPNDEGGIFSGGREPLHQTTLQRS